MLDLGLSLGLLSRDIAFPFGPGLFANLRCRSCVLAVAMFTRSLALFAVRLSSTVLGSRCSCSKLVEVRVDEAVDMLGISVASVYESEVGALLDLVEQNGLPLKV